VADGDHPGRGLIVFQDVFFFHGGLQLDNARIDLPSVIAIRVWLGRNGGVDRAAALEELFKRKPGPTSVRLRLEAPRDFSILIDVEAKVRPDREFKAAIEQICGPECVEKVAG